MLCNTHMSLVDRNGSTKSSGLTRLVSGSSDSAFIKCLYVTIPCLMFQCSFILSQYNNINPNTCASRWFHYLAYFIIVQNLVKALKLAKP